MLIKYQKHGKTAFLHGNRNRLPSCRIADEVKNKVISIYISEYGDANITHFQEILKKDYDISISNTTLNRWFKEELIISPKAHRKTKRTIKKLLQSRLKSSSSEKTKNTIKEAIYSLDAPLIHPSRPRFKYAGEMIQMDASCFEWVKGVIWYLHLAIDDATGTVVGAYFDTKETLNGYYHVLDQILNNYGIPAMFYTDKRTVFEYTKKNRVFDNEDTFTQFSYACHQLGIEIKTTSVAQAKGRVERLNQSFQSRLPIELRRKHIVAINAANMFLKSYLKEYNDIFALRLNGTQSVYETQPSKERINQILAVISKRKIDGGHCIKFKNNYYRLITASGKQKYFIKGTPVLVIESFDNHLYANVLEELYILEKIESHKTYSKTFDLIPIKEKKLHYIPPITHPWRQASYNAYLSKTKHRENQY